MPPVPAVRGDRLVKALDRAGFAVTRVKGSHHRLRHPDGRATTVPVHAGQDVPKGTLRSVLQDTGLTVEELLKYL
jgi:predicted RNA binding protein YcfA (HicA-like mRNA interferase family)